MIPGKQYSWQTRTPKAALWLSCFEPGQQELLAAYGAPNWIN